mmetsp:Transcript_17753/g.30839  ORF Transcript_17753/g.30839 Transcript_17753/m.30839 type:complete len:90 (-) Transcript_17753:41-310(-)
MSKYCMSSKVLSVNPMVCTHRGMYLLCNRPGAIKTCPAQWIMVFGRWMDVDGEFSGMRCENLPLTRVRPSAKSAEREICWKSGDRPPAP